MIENVSVEVLALVNRVLIFLVVLFLGVVAWFLKELAKDVKQVAATVQDHGKIIAAHEVMYSFWLQEMGSYSGPRRRKMDETIQRVMEAEDGP